MSDDDRTTPNRPVLAQSPRQELTLELLEGEIEECLDRLEKLEQNDDAILNALHVIAQHMSLGERIEELIKRLERRRARVASSRPHR